MGNLPKLREETAFIKIELPSGKSIGIKPWRVKQEKDLLFAVEGSGDHDAVRDEIIKFIGRCVDDKQTFAELSNVDLLRIIMELRKLSKGDAIEFEYTCPHCEMKNPTEVKVSKSMKFKIFDFTPIKVNEDLQVFLKDVDYSTMIKIMTDAGDSLSKFNFNYLLESIQSLTIKGMSYPNFTREDLIEFLDDLESNELEFILKELNERASTISLDKKFKCIKCKKEVSVDFGDLYSFLAF